MTLPRSLTPRRAAAAMLIAHALLLAWSGLRHAPTFDETAHLPAGIDHWKNGRFGLYRVNPPLVRMVAALPVLAAGPEIVRSDSSMQPGARPEFKVGTEFMRANGAASFEHFALARWACIPFSLLGGLICYQWARDLWGTAAGLVALALWCFSPTILGNAATIQPDAPAASLAVAVAYLFRSWCRGPRWERALGVGALLGVALLVKTTLALLLPLLPLLWAAQRWPVYRVERRRAIRDLGQIALIWGVSLHALNMAYLFEGSFKRLGDYAFVSEALTGVSNPGGHYDGARRTGNRFASTWLTGIPVPLPEDYVLGIDLQKRDFEGRLKSYLRGRSSDRGWWYYYLYGMAVKTPLGTLALLGIAAGLMLTRGSGGASWREVATLALPGAFIFAVISSETGMTNHTRYVLPALPFLLILGASAGRLLRLGRQLAPAGLAVAAALIASVASSLANYPHSHAYFNELAGGPSNGHYHLLSSNVDYGEDLLYLGDWLRANAPGRPLRLAYFGNFDPRVAGIEFTLPPRGTGDRSRRGRPGTSLGPLPGLHAVSVNYLHGPSVPLHDGRGGRSFEDDFSYFLEFEPTARIGGAIHVYDLDRDAVDRVRRKLGLAPCPPDEPR